MRDVKWMATSRTKKFISHITVRIYDWSTNKMWGFFGKKSHNAYIFWFSLMRWAKWMTTSRIKYLQNKLCITLLGVAIFRSGISQVRFICRQIPRYAEFLMANSTAEWKTYDFCGKILLLLCNQNTSFLYKVEL